MTNTLFKIDRKSIPSNPGVYIYKNKNKEIIYIGKAKNLKNRVSSYFSQKHENSPKTQFLVRNIADVEFIVTNNEIEALLLENKLIKKNKPKYNIFLKDSKTYAYLKITEENIPKLISTRKVIDNGEYFGPFPDAQARVQLQDLTVRIFKLVTSKTYSTKSKLNYEIGLAPAKSLDEIDKEEYLKNIEEAKLFLRGKNINKIIKKLTDEMNDFKESQKYELAIEKRKQIDAINYLNEKQNVDLIKDFDQDVIAQMSNIKDNKSVFILLKVSKGVISDKREFKFEYDEGLFEEFIKMYYSQNYVPREIIVSDSFWKNDEEKEVFEKYLTNQRGSKVILTNPKIGDKVSLINLAKENAKLSLVSQNNILKIIKEKLKLPVIPNTIECFDISNLGSEHIVAGMTRWVNEKPDKDNYRKYQIKSFKGYNDDFKAMREVVYRRYNAIKEKREVNGVFPDLIIIDGGKGQLSSACESLKKLGLEIAIISIAKGSKRDKNEIYFPNETEPVIFDDNSKMMLFLRQVRDSVHNYVISYNRKKRQMQFQKEITTKNS